MYQTMCLKDAILLFAHKGVRRNNVGKDVSPGGFSLEKSQRQPADPFKVQLHLFLSMLIAFLHSNYISVSVETLPSKHVQKNNNRLMMSLSPQSRNVIRRIWCQEKER